jgi:hypothetical protein
MSNILCSRCTVHPTPDPVCIGIFTDFASCFVCNTASEHRRISVGAKLAAVILAVAALLFWHRQHNAKKFTHTPVGPVQEDDGEMVHVMPNEPWKVDHMYYEMDDK